MSREIILPIRQKGNYDCGLAVLAMLLDKGYEDVFNHASKYCHTKGMSGIQLKRLASKLGQVLKEEKLVKGSDLSKETGILFCTKLKHLVIVFNGVIIDPDSALLYTPKAYLGLYNAPKFNYILRIE